MELVVTEDVLLVHRGNNEFGIVDLTTAISIALGEHFINLFIGQIFSKVFSIAILYFYFG
jgi:hypothetical protein